MVKTKADLEQEIKDFQELIDVKIPAGEKGSVPQDEKDYAAKEIVKLQKELEALEKPAATAKVPAKPKEKPVPETAKKKRDRKTKNKNLAELSFEWEGKKILLTEANCFQVMDGLVNRLASSIKANKKYKTKPVLEKVGDSMVNVAGHVESAVSDQRMTDKPKEVLMGAKKMEKGWDMVFEGFEEMTGKKIPLEAQKEIRASLEKVKDDVAAAQG